MMSKTILAEYDAEHNTLKLEEPLEGIADHQRVSIAVADDGEFLAAAMILSEKSLAQLWDNADDAEYDRL